MEENQWFLPNQSTKSRKLQNDNLNEEIKSVVLEKQEFESRDESLKKTILALLDYRDSNAGIELISFRTNSSLKEKSFSLATMVEESKPV